jgi:hypothetical protein
VPDCQWLGNETTPGWYAWCEENDALYYIGDGATHWRHRPESPALPSTDDKSPAPPEARYIKRDREFIERGLSEASNSADPVLAADARRALDAFLGAKP